MSKPKVSYTELESAFTAGSSDYISFLDKRTGEVLSYDNDIEDELLAGGDFSDLPEWQRDEIAIARRVLRSFGELLEEGEEADKIKEAGRYIEIPHIESHEAYETMVEFAETVTDSHLRDLLDVALRGQGAFRRFKDVLLGFPAERERWFAFSDERLREQIKAWADDEGVVVDFTSEKIGGGVE